MFLWPCRSRLEEEMEETDSENGGVEPAEATPAPASVPKIIVEAIYGWRWPPSEETKVAIKWVMSLYLFGLKPLSLQLLLCYCCRLAPFWSNVCLSLSSLHCMICGSWCTLHLIGINPKMKYLCSQMQNIGKAFILEGWAIVSHVRPLSQSCYPRCLELSSLITHIPANAIIVLLYFHILQGKGI